MGSNNSTRPGYSSMILILDSDFKIVGREKDHLHARALALEMGYDTIEDCQPGRKRWKYVDGCWIRIGVTEKEPEGMFEGQTIGLKGNRP